MVLMVSNKYSCTQKALMLQSFLAAKWLASRSKPTNSNVLPWHLHQLLSIEIIPGFFRKTAFLPAYKTPPCFHGMVASWQDEIWGCHSFSVKDHTSYFQIQEGIWQLVVVLQGHLPSKSECIKISICLLAQFRVPNRPWRKNSFFFFII